MGPDLWSALNPYDQLGLTRQVPASALSSTAPNTSVSSGPSKAESAPLWSPDSPLFWVAGLLLATAGFIGVSTSARIGPLKTGASLGKS